MTKKPTPAAEAQRQTTVVLISALLLIVVEQSAGHGPLWSGAKASA